MHFVGSWQLHFSIVVAVVVFRMWEKPWARQRFSVTVGAREQRHNTQQPTTNNKPAKAKAQKQAKTNGKRKQKKQREESGSQGKTGKEKGRKGKKREDKRRTEEKRRTDEKARQPKQKPNSNTAAQVKDPKATESMRESIQAGTNEESSHRQ